MRSRRSDIAILPRPPTLIARNSAMLVVMCISTEPAYAGRSLVDRGGHAEDRRERAGQALPVIAAVRARVDLAVARADVHAARLQAVRVHALAVRALVVVGA